ncbi:hypothetical protein [Lysinibacillus sphaericus]|nr:hypothetical protein [Lysinibacillus sphaericus]
MADNNVYYRAWSETGWRPWRRLMTDIEYDTLFQSVSSGKALVANATTYMGVQTSTTAEFATIAAIPTGIPYSTGTYTTISNTMSF